MSRNDQRMNKWVRRQKTDRLTQTPQAQTAHGLPNFSQVPGLTKLADLVTSSRTHTSIAIANPAPVSHPQLLLLLLLLLLLQASKVACLLPLLTPREHPKRWSSPAQRRARTPSRHASSRSAPRVLTLLLLMINPDSILSHIPHTPGPTHEQQKSGWGSEHRLMGRSHVSFSIPSFLF